MYVPLLCDSAIAVCGGGRRISSFTLRLGDENGGSATIPIGYGGLGATIVMANGGPNPKAMPMRKRRSLCVLDEVRQRGAAVVQWRWAALRHLWPAMNLRIQ